MLSRNALDPGGGFSQCLLALGHFTQRATEGLAREPRGILRTPQAVHVLLHRCQCTVNLTAAVNHAASWRVLCALDRRFLHCALVRHFVVPTVPLSVSG